MIGIIFYYAKFLSVKVLSHVGFELIHEQSSPHEYTAKSDRDAARDAARQVDLDKQAAIWQLKKDSEAAQLQLDA